MENTDQVPRITLGWGPNLGKTAMLYPVVFLVAMAGGTSALGLIFFAKSVLGASPGQIGFLAAIWSTFYMCGCYSFRRLPAILPSRYSILAAAFMSFVSIGLIFLLKSLFWSFVFYACCGLSVSLFWPVVMGWLSAGLEGRRLSRVIGWFNFSWSVGAIISPVVAGWLEDMGNSFALRAGSLTYLLAAGLSFAGILLVPALSEKQVVPARKPDPNSDRQSGTFLRYPAWFSAFTSFFLVGTIVTVIPLAAGAELDISKKMVGILLLVRALTMSGALVGMGQTSWWHFRGRQMAIGALAGVFAAIILAFTRSTVTIGFMMVIVGVIIGQAYTNSVFHGISGVPDKSWRMAVHEMVINAGLILGTISGGLAYGAFGLTAAFLICVAIWMIDFGVASVLLNILRKREAAQGALS